MTKELLPINVPYSPDKQKRLKRFCGIVGSTVSRFTAEALDSEIVYRLEEMDKTTRASVEKLLEPK